MVVVTDPGLLRQASYKLTNHMMLDSANRGVHRYVDTVGLFSAR